MLVVLLLASSCFAAQLVLMDGQASGAVCLDGSRPGFYFRKGINKLMIGLEGGGWCYNEQDCVGRSKTTLGSSANWTQTANFTTWGPLSELPSVNKFWNWTMMYLKYCDGASFSGDVEDPVSGVYFRGKRIRDLFIKTILNNYNGNGFEEILLTGCSAGGLATYIHADTFAAAFPSAKKFKAAPVSGYFLDSPNLALQDVYPSQMENVFSMQNAQVGVNQACVSATPKASQYLCMFAQHAYKFVKTPLLLQNSMYDWWSMYSIMLGGMDGSKWESCLNSNGVNCTAAEVLVLNAWKDRFLGSYGNGTSTSSFYFHSSISHCGGWFALWNSIKINDTTVQDAWWNWFNNDVLVRLEGCTLTLAPPHQCADGIARG